MFDKINLTGHRHETVFTDNNHPNMGQKFESRFIRWRILIHAIIAVVWLLNVGPG